MEEKEIEILQNICVKTGHKSDWWEYRFNANNEETANIWLRGFLLSISTAKAWWGSEPVDSMGLTPKVFHKQHPDRIFLPFLSHEWQFHVQQCSLLENNSEILAYYYKQILRKKN